MPVEVGPIGSEFLIGAEDPQFGSLAVAFERDDQGKLSATGSLGPKGLTQIEAHRQIDSSRSAEALSSSPDIHAVKPVS